MVTVLSTVNVAHAEATCGKSVFNNAGTGSSCEKAINWFYDRRSQSFSKPGAIVSVEHPEPTYVHELVSACTSITDCQAAHNCPNRQLRYNSSYYLATATGEKVEPPLGVESVCVSLAQTIPLSSITNSSHEELRRQIAAPQFASAPPGKTLINIITIYSTTPQPEPRIDITTPVPGSIVAVPEYRWDFGDGQTAVGPGVPYQAGDDPAQLPGKYLGPVWRTGGTKHVTLAVTWRVRFLLEGLVDVPLAPIIFTATEDKQIATARAVLVNR